MSYSYPEIKQLRGLYLQANSFSVPDGACEELLNVVVKNDFIWSSRNGYYPYFTPLTGTLNNLFKFQNRLLAIYQDKLEYYTDTGTVPNETGSETAITGETISLASRTSRPLFANTNLYFTTDNGMLKLPSFDGTLTKAGAPQGLDIRPRFDNTSVSTFFPPYVGTSTPDPLRDTVLGYRVVFGYLDANDNLILGAPSQIASIQNTVAVDVSWTRTSNVVSVTSNAHGLKTNDYIFVANSTGSTAVVEGTYQVTVTGTNTFSFPETAANDSGVLDYGKAMPVRIEISIPEEITTALPWFYQVYRSSRQLATVGLFSDFKLVTQTRLSSSEITAGIAYYDDSIDESLLGAELYTNENSREGELQANYRPPLCEDVSLFKGYALYANCTTRHLIDLSVIDTTVMSQTDYIEVKVSATRRYVAQTGVANRTVKADCADDGSGNIALTFVAHGFSAGDSIYIDNVVGGTLASGIYFVINAGADTFEISTSKGGSNVAYNSETVAEIQGVTEGTGDYPMFYLSEDASAAVRLRDTAELLTKAINRDNSAEVYAQYISGINDIPGKFRLQAIGFGDAISLRANTTAVGAGFSPNFPDSFSSGTQVTSSNESLPHTFFSSKEGESEAVPLPNFFPVGSRNAAIIRSKALRDSYILLKEDGVWRVTGDNPGNFSATLLDGTVICVAKNSVDVLNNQVVFLSNQGICFVTESSVQIISRQGIEDPLQPILGQANLDANTAAFAYESERLYVITTTLPNDTSPSVTYVYNILTQQWSTWDIRVRASIIGPSDRNFFISTDNVIKKERKNQNRTDFADDGQTITIDAISGTTVTLTVTSRSPQFGDMILKDNVISRLISTPVLIAGNQYTSTLDAVNNLEVADTPIMYSSYVRRMKLAPYHAGLVGRNKFFSTLQVHLRDNSMSRATFTFSGPTFGGSEEVNWVSESVATDNGWGNFDWGFENWGNETGINIVSGSQPAPIARIAIPARQARNTYIQPIIEHRLAGEPTNIQAIAFTVRAYSSRTTK